MTDWRFWGKQILRVKGLRDSGEKRGLGLR
jgi:hypothetical protein